MREPVIVAGFPITYNTSLRGYETHRDIPYEICNHSRYTYDHSEETKMTDAPGTWCYYVTISEYMLPPEEFKKFWLRAKKPSYEPSNGIPWPSYDYYEVPWAGCDWHGGVTFYSKTASVDKQPRSVKIGCDFGHYWDEGREYNYEEVQREAIRTVEHILEMFQFYSRCCYSGRWQPLEEMISHCGRLYSHYGLDKKLEHDKQREEIVP